MASRGSPSNKKNKRGVAGPAFEALFERIASYAVRARGLLHKASVATASLLAGMTEPSSWDLSEAVVPRFPLQYFSILL